MNFKPPAYYVFAVLTGLACIGLLVVGKESFEAVWDRSLGAETPQQMTVAELLKQGAGANRHVTATQVAVGGDYVMLSRTGETENETYLVDSPTARRRERPARVCSSM